jgi:hypothetical protein
VSAIALALCLSINLTCDQEMDQPQQFQTTQSLPAESGHWPAPRSKFLIDAPAAVSTAPATTSEPKVTARKLAARRVVGKKAFTKKVATQDPTAAKNSAFVVGGFKREAQQGVNERKLMLSKRLRAYVRTPRMANEMHG